MLLTLTCKKEAPGFALIVFTRLKMAKKNIGDTQNRDKHHPMASAHGGNVVVSYLVGLKSTKVNIKMNCNKKTNSIRSEEEKTEQMASFTKMTWIYYFILTRLYVEH